MLAADDGGIRKLAEPAPQAVTQHVRAHGIRFGEPARPYPALAAGIEHTVPVEDDGAALIELCCQFLDGTDKSTPCRNEFIDESWRRQLHHILDIEDANRFFAIECNDCVDFRLFEFRDRIVEQGIRGNGDGIL